MQDRGLAGVRHPFCRFAVDVEAEQSFNGEEINEVDFEPFTGIMIGNHHGIMNFRTRHGT